mgnify:CR=1 FL=1
MNDLNSSPFKFASTMARKSQSKWKVGSCLTKKRKIISGGYNQRKSHPFTLTLRNKLIKGLHSEMHAVLGVEPDNLIGTSIYVVRIRRNNSIGMAKPCGECYRLLAKVGVKQAFFTTEVGEIERIKINSY